METEFHPRVDAYRADRALSFPPMVRAGGGACKSDDFRHIVTRQGIPLQGASSNCGEITDVRVILRQSVTVTGIIPDWHGTCVIYAREQ